MFCLSNALMHADKSKEKDLFVNYCTQYLLMRKCDVISQSKLTSYQIYFLVEANSALTCGFSFGHFFAFLIKIHKDRLRPVSQDEWEESSWPQKRAEKN